jgi:hypothetical protein
MQKPWMNLRGPARIVAISATVLLIASGMLGVEAGLMIVLGPDGEIVRRPFVILIYLETCAIFFSVLGIVGGIICMIFYRPYRYISDKIYFFRARHTAEVSNEYLYFQDVHPAQAHNPEKQVWRG